MTFELPDDDRARNGERQMMMPPDLVPPGWFTEIQYRLFGRSTAKLQAVQVDHPWLGRRPPPAAKAISEERLQSWMVPRADGHSALSPGYGRIYLPEALARARRVKIWLAWAMGVFAVLALAALFWGPILAAIATSRR